MHYESNTHDIEFAGQSTFFVNEASTHFLPCEVLNGVEDSWVWINEALTEAICPSDVFIR